MDFSFILDIFYLKTLLQGLLFTLMLALIAVLFGTLIAIIPTYLRLSKHKVFNIIGSAYVEAYTWYTTACSSHVNVCIYTITGDDVF